ncbi:Dipeptidyl aminopeptidase/acylaminoacyl peptidase [Natronoarchaeum philippinense]|uniref:Dipeptidyl aminopeptidase/acylaminoacyl peptidase n=1 Tax=Natronoarchaeum philippinense TaxID=558529 RepID=A0A285P2Q4_NATPI|nr:prolyl oligopeptidase family serine peptidase [Natronoarchaeum philippinense]SNZ16010.1 Dipeptidyl aminopeptidase/acylaminoacyl peptidase [Natronoarchaeum philippinense]
MADDDGDLLEELASLPTFHHPTASPDGDEVAVYYDGTGRNELHLIDAETGESTRISDGEVPRNARWHVEWGADGERVFFHLDDDGNEQNDVHAIDRDGSAEAVVEMDGQVSLADVGADGETLLVGSSAGGQMNLYRHDLPTGETTKLTDYERAAYGGTLSPDCDRIAYGTNETDAYENMDVYVANADGSEPRNLEIGETGAESAPADWGPEGDRLLVQDNTEDLTRCGIYDLRTDEVTWYGDLDAEEQPVAFLPDGERFLAHRTRDAAIAPVVYDVESGASSELDLPEGVSQFPGGQGGDAALSDDRVVVTHTTADRRPELLAYDLDTDEYETLLDAEYGDLDPDAFADAEFFTFESHGVDGFQPSARQTESDGGLEIEALLYDSGERPSPAIVKPHGGPRGQDTRSFDLYTQFLVSQGYSVLEVNYRGSTGRGREFVELLYDDWGGDEQADIAEGARLLREKEWIDEDRIAVFGGSYGGYSAYCQMTMYPELYDAGVAWIGLTDLQDMYENTMPHFRTELLEKNIGSPEDNPELYRERSPVTHVENVSAPLLMLHGVNDRRVPVSQSRIFRDALVDAGYTEGEDADFEYVELGEEGHASSDIDQKIRLFEILADFLDRRL